MRAFLEKVFRWAPAGEGFRRLALLFGVVGVLVWTASVLDRARWTRDLPVEGVAWTFGCAGPRQIALEKRSQELARQLQRPLTAADTAAISMLVRARGDTTRSRVRDALAGVDYECRQLPFVLGRATFWLLWLPLAFLLPWGVFQVLPLTISWVVAGFQRGG